MTGERNDLLKKAQDALALTDVYIRDVSASLDDRFLPITALHDEWEVQTKIQTSFHRVADRTVESEDEQGAESATFVEYKVVAGARFIHPSLLQDDGAVCIAGEVAVVFALVYQAKEDLSHEILGEFGRRNAPFHVWPYWREFLHSTTGRMRLPPSVLPMYQFHQAGAPPALANESEKTEVTQQPVLEVGVKDMFDLAFWSTAMNVTKDQLREAVAAVGTSPDAVRSHLGESANT